MGDASINSSGVKGHCNGTLRMDLSTNATPGLLHADHLSEASAEKTNELLSLNNSNFHAYFHYAGMHNHILHHLLAIYALGASPELLESAYKRNADYQKPRKDRAALTLDLSDPMQFRQHLEQPDFYGDYLEFFKAEVATKGIGNILNQYVFAGTEQADDMLARMYGGLLHPIIHLGYGVEFQQPLLVAEALASAAIHDTFMADICFPAEKAASQRPSGGSRVSMMRLVQRLQSDAAIRDAISEEETHNKLATDLMPREGKRLIEMISEYTVQVETLEEQLAEMIQTNCYLIAAAQVPKKAIAFDFYIMHAVNLSIFTAVFLRQTWLSDENKVRLLQWKVWLDLAVFASCKSPALYPERITSYKPERPGDWDSIFARAVEYKDDGHTAKLIRAIKLGEVEARTYPVADIPLRVEDYLTVAHMVMDCVEVMDRPDYKRPEVVYFEDTSEEVLRLVARWIRFCGTQIAWKDVPMLEARN